MQSQCHQLGYGNIVADVIKGLGKVYKESAH